MPDFLSRKERSERMATIRSKDTKLERLFFSKIGPSIHRSGFRYRKHYKQLPGKPDVVFPSRRLAVFIDSSFWHGRNFKSLRRKLTTPYWNEKIRRNLKHDASVNAWLRREGWAVLRLWDTDLEQRPIFCKRRLMAQ